MAVRILLAVVVGGLLGLERERRSSPAGFRTYMLVAIGSSMTIMLSQYIDLMLSTQWAATAQSVGATHDVSRFGAQVINGVGFLGAGSIILTGRKRVKGLTTAAGLWTSAIIGLVCGAGYVECAIFATVMVLVAELLLVKVEYRFVHKVNDVNLYIEYADAVCIESIIRIAKENHITMNGLEITRVAGEGDSHYYCAVLTLQASLKQLDEKIVKSISNLEDVINIEEL